MLSLIQRSYSAPRDFYDIWYLSNQFTELDYNPIIDAFHKKLKFKGYKYTGVEQLINPENEKSLRSAWVNSLSHQISGNFPEFDLVRDDLLKLFSRIFQ